MVQEINCWSLASSTLMQFANLNTFDGLRFLSLERFIDRQTDRLKPQHVNESPEFEFKFV